jgi:hypothetical protein
VSKVAHRGDTAVQVLATNCAPINTRLLGDSTIASNSPGTKSPLYRRERSASDCTVGSTSRWV